MKYYDTDMVLKESDWDMAPMSKHLLNLLFGRIKEVDSEDILNLLMWFKGQLKSKYPDLYEKFNAATTYSDIVAIGQEYVNRMCCLYGR